MSYSETTKEEYVEGSIDRINTFLKSVKGPELDHIAIISIKVELRTMYEVGIYVERENKSTK